eukprot:9347896-Lingulodinium_polyedra.AAC.1
MLHPELNRQLRSAVKATRRRTRPEHESKSGASPRASDEYNAPMLRGRPHRSKAGTGPEDTAGTSPDT